MGYGPEEEGLGYEGSDGGKSMIKKRHYPECDNEIVMISVRQNFWLPTSRIFQWFPTYNKNV